MCCVDVPITLQHFGNPQITKNQPPIPQQKQILCLQIPVHYPVFMHVVKPKRQLLVCGKDYEEFGTPACIPAQTNGES